MTYALKITIPLPVGAAQMLSVIAQVANLLRLPNYTEPAFYQDWLDYTEKIAFALGDLGQSMQYQVFVPRHSKQHFVASVVGMPSVIVEGKTEQEAIAKVKAALEAQLAHGKFVTIEVNPQEQSQQIAPQMRYAGILAIRSNER